MPSLDALRFYVAPTASTRRLATPDATYESVLEISFRLFFKGWNVISGWDGVWAQDGRIPDLDHVAKLEEAVQSCKSITILDNCSYDDEQQAQALLRQKGVRFFRAEPRKPHPAAFCRVLEELELDIGDIETDSAYIGSNIFTDIYGARNAGFAHVIRVLSPEATGTLRARIARKLEKFYYERRT